MGKSCLIKDLVVECELPRIGNNLRETSREEVSEEEEAVSVKDSGELEADMQNAGT